MNRLNPLIVETWHGLTNASQAQLTYLNCLLLQAAVLMLWWPKRTLSEALLKENPPDSLLAIVIAVGFTCAYYALRIGAEEVLLKGQQPLVHWAGATALSLPRILLGYLGGRGLQISHALLLSSPLVLAAYSVGGGSWPALGWCMVAVLVQAVFYLLLGAVVCTLAGRHGTRTFVSIRAILLGVYTATMVLLPVASQVMVTHKLLTLQAWLTTSDVPLPVMFVVLYVSASMMMAALLVGLLANHRRQSTSITTVDNQKRDSHSRLGVDIRRKH